MGSNILFVSPNANDQISQLGNPNAPFSLTGAITFINNRNSQTMMNILLADGDYTKECPRQLNITSDVIIIGSSPRHVRLSLSNINITNGSTCSIQNVTLITCQSSPVPINQPGMPGSVQLVMDSLLTVDNSSVELINVDMIIRQGRPMQLNNASLMMNNCNLDITVSRDPGAPILDSTNGGLSVFNTNITIKYVYTLSSNTAIIGLKAGTGFATVSNVYIESSFNGGRRNIYMFYNVNMVSNVDVKVQGTGIETFVLEAIDIKPVQSPNPTANPTIFISGLNINAQGFSSLYSSLNVFGYPVTMNNVVWNNGTANPGPYNIGQSNIPRQIPIPQELTAPVQFAPSTSPYSISAGLPGYQGQQRPSGNQIGLPASAQILGANYLQLGNDCCH